MMNTNQDNLRRIFSEAADLRGDERAAFLKEACGADEQLRASVERLLKHDAEVGSFMNAPVIALPVAPTLDVAPVTERPGTRIGPYELLEQIGEGGMGVVYVASQREPISRKVALKIIKPGMDTRAVVARFETERQALAMMDHPNIAKVFDAGATDAGRPYFVMELVKGKPITEYCDRAQLSTRERLELFVTLCHGVQHAHQKGVIHRDLKPSNLLVEVHDVRPVPKIIDFGVAKAMGQHLTEMTLHTGFEQMVGTPLYMSPEQAGLSSVDVDTRSDIYSLGVLLYEMLTGHTPFEKDTLRTAGVDELRRIIREVDPPRPSARVSTLAAAELSTIAEHRHIEPRKLSHLLHGDLDWIAMKALDKDRSRRYETALGLSQDVERYLGGEPVEARPASTSYRLKKFVGRHKTAISFWALLAASLLVGAGAAMWQAARASDARDRAVDAEQLAQQRLARAESAERAGQLEVDKAKTEAAISAAVIQFINEDLFCAADPSWEPNRELKVREVLDRAAARIEGRFQDQPLVEAAICHVLGRSYKSLGMYDEAELLLLRARKLRADALGAEDVLTLQTACELVDLRLWRGDYAAAEQLASDILNAQRRNYGAAHPEVLETMRLLGTCYRARGRFAEAQQLVSDVLQEQRRTLGLADLRTWKTTLELARCYLVQGQYKEAESLMAQTVETMTREHGPDFPGTIDGMHGLAKCYLAEGRYPAAEALLAEVLKWRQRVLGSEHYDTLESQTEMAECLRRQNRLAEAQRLYSESLDMQRRVLGDKHPRTLGTMSSLATCYSDQGAIAEAEALLSEALAIQRTSLGDEHPATLSTTHNLAACYRELGQLDKAAELEQQTLEIVRQKLGAHHPQTLAAMGDLATTYLALDRADEAAELCSEARETALAQWGETGPITLGITNNLANCLDKLERYQEAETLYSKLLEQVGVVLGQNHPNTLRTANNLASCCQKQGRYAEAEQLFTQTREDVTRVLGPEHPFTLVVLNNLAGCYVAQGRYAEGAKLHTQTLEQRRRVLGAEHPATKRSIQTLAECWALWAQSLLRNQPAEDTNPTRALELAKQSVELAPEAAIGWTALGEAQFNLGDWRACTQTLEKAVSLETKEVSSGTYFLLAMACLHLGQASEAHEYAEDYRKVCAEMLQRFGQTDKPDDAHWVAWACALVPDATTDWPKVIALAEQAVKSDPKSAIYLNTLGAALYRAGRFEEARARLSEADDPVQQPSDALVSPPAYTWFFLAMAHHQLGHSAEAKKWLDKAVAWTDKIIADTDHGTADLSGNRRLTLQLFRDEAMALLTSASAAVPSKPVPKAQRKQPGERHKPQDDVKAG